MKANVCLYLPTTHGNLRTFYSWKAFSLFEKCSDLERLLGYGLPSTYTNYFFPMFIWKWCSFHISTSDSLWWRWKRKHTYFITLEEFFFFKKLWPNINLSISIMVLGARIHNILPIEWRHQYIIYAIIWPKMCHLIDSFEQFISEV